MTFILEIYSEEIPARMQLNAAEQATRSWESLLKENSIKFKEVTTFVTPRRLTIQVEGLLKKQPDIEDERKGPKIEANEKAIEGFSKSTGLSVDKLEQREIEGKGTFYFAVIKKKGAPTKDILAELSVEFLNKFTWPKSMKWGESECKWVRPIKNILALFNDKKVEFNYHHIKSTAQTFGLYWDNQKAITLKEASEYTATLNKNGVELNQETRKNSILAQAQELAKSKKGKLSYSDYLLNEIAGLVEHSRVLIGSIDKEFMELPKEVLISSIRAHQKYICLENKDGELLPYFIFATNSTAKQTTAIVEGNERVLRARLADAVFFKQQDSKVELSEQTQRLKGITFHNKLGTVYDKTKRINSNADFVSVFVPHADLNKVDQAAKLCKSDLVTEMVGEFPELQGFMGEYYAHAEGQDEEVALAIGNHYKPAGASDECPKEPVSICISLADKFDTLAGMFLIGEKPTGSKDPFALRRAALGIIRIILENSLSMRLDIIITHAIKQYPSNVFESEEKVKLLEKIKGGASLHIKEITSELLNFFEDRLTYFFKDNKNINHELIPALFAKNSDIIEVISQVKAITDFANDNENGEVIAAFKRAKNILEIEEKKSGSKIKGKVNDKYFTCDDEVELSEALNSTGDISSKVQNRDYSNALNDLGSFTKPLNDFLDNVTINAEDSNIRSNRYKILASVRDVFEAVGL